MKICTKCGKEKEHFNKGMTWCRDCTKAYAADRRQKARGGKPVREVWREFTGEIVQCRTCGKRKPLTRENFRPGGSTNGAHIRKDCRECCNAERRAYKQRNVYQWCKSVAYQAMRDDAKKGLISTLTCDDILANFVHKPCSYCGFIGWSGADRKDNTLPHSIDNCVPACALCNLTRNNRFTVSEMINHIGPAIRKIREERQ